MGTFNKNPRSNKQIGWSHDWRSANNYDSNVRANVRYKARLERLIKAYEYQWLTEIKVEPLRQSISLFESIKKYFGL